MESKKVQKLASSKIGELMKAGAEKSRPRAQIIAIAFSKARAASSKSAKADEKATTSK